MQVGAEEKGQGVWERLGNAGKKKGRWTHFWLLQKGVGLVGFFPNTCGWAENGVLGGSLEEPQEKGSGEVGSSATASELHSRAAG